MHKQHFDLRTGVCVDDESVTVRVYPVRVADGQVLVGSP
jgi:nitrite reductase (NADH) small subunit